MKKHMPIFIPNIQGKWCIKTKERSTKNVTMKGKKAIQKVKSKKEGKININHRQSSVMTLLIDKKEIVKKNDAQRKIGRNLKNEYKSHTKQCDDTVNRQKEIVKKMMPEEKLEEF